MAGLEFEGKTVKDAIENACVHLNISQRELKYDVISNGSSGIFGFVGAKKAKIRVYNTPKSEFASKPGGGRTTGEQSSSGIDSREVISLVDEAFNNTREETPVQKEAGVEKKNKPHHRKRTAPTTKAPIKIDTQTSEPSTEPDVDSFDSPSCETEIDVHPDLEKKVSIVAAKTKSFDEEDTTAQDVIACVEPAETDETIAACTSLGLTALQKILDYLTDGVNISLEKNQDKFLYRIEGGNSSMLIGKRGQNLEAIQYIIDKIVNKNMTKHIRIQVDVAGYTEKRKENLIKMAERMAQKTKRTGKPSTVGPMNAQDRRIVHIALKNFRGVRTQSMGEGYYRKLMIFPKQTSRKKSPADTTETENKSA